MPVPWWFGVTVALAGEGSALPSPWTSAPLPAPWGPFEEVAPPVRPGPGEPEAAPVADPAPRVVPAPVAVVGVSRDVTTVDPALHPGAWGLRQPIEVAVPDALRSLYVHDDVTVELSPAAARRVVVVTDPGLLAEARTAFEGGRLSLFHESEAPPPRYEVEGPLPAAVRTEGAARVEVVGWTGERLDLWAWGDSVIDVRDVRAELLVVVARENAEIRVTGACEVGDLRVDTADAATFVGCGG